MNLPDWNPPTPEEVAFLPGLAANGIALRPYRPCDILAAAEAARSSRAEIGQWLTWCHRDYGLADAEAFVTSRAAAWSRSEEFAFAITRESDGRFLGGCGLNEINKLHRCANLGYWVRNDETSRGVASTAARLLAHFGIAHLGLRRIEIVAAVGNIASQRAALKAGATREGVLRNRLAIHGTNHDAVVFSIVPADIETATSSGP